MKQFYLLGFLLLYVVGISTGQADYKWFSSINASQNTNYFIYNSTHNQVFISSWDGLNIFDGLEVKTYRPSTHHMQGNKIDSPFFEDSTGKVWFTTKEALHYYNPESDDLDYMFMRDECGEIIKSNYRIFLLSGSNLYMSAEKQLMVLDVAKRVINKIVSLDSVDFTPSDIFFDHGKLLLFSIDPAGYEMYELDERNNIKLVYNAKGNFSAYCRTVTNKIWLGKQDGSLMQLDPLNGKILYNYTFVGSRIIGIQELSGNKLLISIHPNEIFEFDPLQHKRSNWFIPRRSGTKESADYLTNPVLDRDSTLWIGCASQGVFFYSPNKQKFQHFLNAGPDQKPFNITNILPLQDDRYLIFTRRQGAVIINQGGAILQHWLELPNGIRNFTSTGATQVDEHHFLFISNNELYLLDLERGAIGKLQYDHSKPPLNFRQIETLENGKVLASCEEDLLLQIQLSDGAYTYKPYAQLENLAVSTGFFKTDRTGNLYISNDESSLLVLAPTSDGNHQFSYELPIGGGITSLAEVEDKSEIYITTTNGLFCFNKETCDLALVIDIDKWLLQTIYAAIPDSEGNLWLSTNTGILKYNPDTGNIKAFSRMDGVQADEFNTHAYLQTKDGGIFFGGINGLNFFYPEQVNLSTKAAPVYISQVKVNDEVDTTFGVPQFIHQYKLRYQRNTISFEFHAIDYADPSATRVKYKMVGVDQDYVESNSVRGFARYANLQPGKYIFSILGANADGVWNTTPREVEILILRPFWMTWWFYAICFLTGIAIIYLTIRAYYQRKLERNNLLVREQALIIEKQRAVEHERNRIAAEMHDDLGSGLTTIRYLSDRALKQAKDADESKQIRKIADHSNKLVRNMSEIIWAMNSRFDTADNLVGYLRRFASEYLEEHQIPLKFIAEAEHLDKIAMGGEKRRNVFLVFKEMLHNAVKYSSAECIAVRIEGNHQLHIEISEIGGKGFDPELAKEKGNGLFNCSKRMDSVGGQLTFEKTDEAMHIHIRIPLNQSADE